MFDNLNCNTYRGGKVPPCSAFLNNVDPIIIEVLSLLYLRIRINIFNYL